MLKYPNENKKLKQSDALKILKSGQNTFITGSAGTGKSYLLNQYIDYLKSNQIIPVVVAPTGIASSHIGGKTIHSYFSLGIRNNISDVFIYGLLEKSYLVTRFGRLRVLIIDEVSMVSPEIFEAMNKILKAFKQSDSPFGGVQVVVSGDFFQLPPIFKGETKKVFSWQSDVWRDLNFNTCYLQDIFRQKEDKIISLLNDIREGNITSSSQDIIAQAKSNKLNLHHKATKLYTHNVDVDRINLLELDKLPSPLRIFTSSSKGKEIDVQKMFKNSLVIKELSLKVDAVVIFIKNNFDKNYVNGTTGVVKGFNDDKVYVEIPSGEKILVSKEEWKMEDDNGKSVCSIYQIPLRLGWAITVHKSQGMSLSSAQIDLSKTFELGQGYVAISRLESIDGLKIDGINDMALRVNPLILKIDNKIKQASKKSYKYINSISDSQLKINYKNHISNLKDEQIFTIKEKIPTHIKTKNLIDKVSNIQELSNLRGVTKTTILKHLKKIKKEFPEINLEKFDTIS
jgi:hypothetical protein